MDSFVKETAAYGQHCRSIKVDVDPTWVEVADDVAASVKQFLARISPTRRSSYDISSMRRRDLAHLQFEGIPSFEVG